MMLTLMYSFYVVVVLLLLGYAISTRPPAGRGYWVLLVFVLFGLFYDNLIVSIGALLGAGDLLYALSVGRFAGHAFGTPLLTIFAFGVARHAGLGWAQGKTAHALICLFTTLLIGLGIYSDLIVLELKTRVTADILSYGNFSPDKLPPIPPFATILAMIFMGIAVWRVSGWKWLALGALFMFFAGAFGTGERLFISNLGEVVLGLSCVASANQFFKRA